MESRATDVRLSLFSCCQHKQSLTLSRNKCSVKMFIRSFTFHYCFKSQLLKLRLVYVIKETGPAIQQQKSPLKTVDSHRAATATLKRHHL